MYIISITFILITILVLAIYFLQIIIRYIIQIYKNLKFTNSAKFKAWKNSPPRKEYLKITHSGMNKVTLFLLITFITTLIVNAPTGIVLLAGLFFIASSIYTGQIGEEIKKL